MHPLRTCLPIPQLQQNPVTPRKERIIPARRKEVIRETDETDASCVVGENSETRRRITDRLAPQTILVPDLNQPNVCVHPAVLEEEWPADEV
jgi:hypothetical protein